MRFAADISASPALVLFDIDGTLLRRSGPHHRQALIEAVDRVSGFAVTTDGIAVQGMLDSDILTAMMRASGASGRRIRTLLPAIMEAAQDYYEKRCPDLSGKLCPGARDALRRLERNQIPAGLVTGNLRRIGWKKMECAGLKEYFKLGAFAGEAATRSELARLAIRRARREGFVSRSTPITLIGDHPNDILAARANRIRSIAVATGLSSAAELAAHSPDHLLGDLRELELEMLL